MCINNQRHVLQECQKDGLLEEETIELLESLVLTPALRSLEAFRFSDLKSRERLGIGSDEDLTSTAAFQAVSIDKQETVTGALAELCQHHQRHLNSESDSSGEKDHHLKQTLNPVSIEDGASSYTSYASQAPLDPLRFLHAAQNPRVEEFNESDVRSAVSGLSSRV